ncbi:MULTISPECIES: recombinase family protein [unclassified Gemella]|uniref:recombinase family protein n=1 Tax=unclassified Gemella TaxID=2624949 RepID=UPI0015CF88ED|nr:MULTISPECIES: recombinase family protein [unclassified Gemella]MBF0710816.1 recombinase family protein [Gemella sp. GL1.1]NYS28160.1 recombinase family protein [Gemella sp. GL1]
MTRKVITIEPAKIISQKNIIPSLTKRRVAGYARVSTDNEDQASSYETQMNYYKNYIESRSDWEYVKMYSDEGISGTNTKKRLGFQEMLEDALKGKIDLIITKSVSRFARNTVDSLTTVRKLKEVGVEIYFEKENIWTLDSKGELLITIMSSLAQEESRSISENVTWSKRKLAAEGQVQFNYTLTLGFKQKQDGGFEIDEEEAKIVRYIFGEYLKGENPNSIAKKLTEKQIPTPAGKKIWSYTTIKRILSNEKYKGDALLQKSYTVDFLTKTRKENKGQLPQYYVENSHEAIIDKTTFDLVQEELKSRARRIKISYGGKIICGDCGHSFGRHTWHSTSKYKRHIYRCSYKYKGKENCTTPHTTQEEIEAWIVKATNKLITNKKEIIENLKVLTNIIEQKQTKTTEEIEELEQKLENIEMKVEELVRQNSRKIQDQEAYQEKYNRLVNKYRKLEETHIEKQNQRIKQEEQKLQIKIFIEKLKKQSELLEEFDEQLFNTLVEKLVIKQDKEIEVQFKSGQVVSI